jgi:hypothetical protein
VIANAHAAYKEIKMQKITIWKREDANTTPRGFGNAPTYHIDEPYHSDKDMIWVTAIEITLPDGYEVSECVDGSKQLYDKKGDQIEILDDHGHPAILLDIYNNKQGKPYGHFIRLDK